MYAKALLPYNKFFYSAGALTNIYLKSMPNDTIHESYSNHMIVF